VDLMICYAFKLVIVVRWILVSIGMMSDSTKRFEIWRGCAARTTTDHDRNPSKGSPEAVLVPMQAWRIRSDLDLSHASAPDTCGYRTNWNECTGFT
jgi:hypothetical protein